MNHGHIEQIAQPQKIYDEPASLYVAGFIGKMNFLKGVAEGESIHIGSLSLPNEKGLSGQVTAAVRPEDVQVSSTTMGEGILAGKVKQVMILGHYAEVTVELMGFGIIRAFLNKEFVEQLQKPFVSLLTVVGLSMSLLAGCGSGSENTSSSTDGNAAASGNPVSFNFYFTGSQNVKDLWDSLEPMFEKEHPDIDVNLVYIPSGTGAEPTYDRIVAAKKAGKGSGDIDLYEDGINYVAQGTKDGIWTQLNEKDIPNLSKVNADTMKDVDNFAVPYRSS
ncbi:hypothetical protein PC115_g25090, partial [Phytophthora cactorum]